MVLDTVGAPYLQKNCEALAMDGKIVLIGWMGGMTVKEFDLMIVVKKRVSIIGARRHPCQLLAEHAVMVGVVFCLLAHCLPRSSWAQGRAHRLGPVCADSSGTGS